MCGWRCCHFRMLYLLLPIAMLVGPLQAIAQAPSLQDGPLQTSSDVTRVHVIGNDAIIRMSKAGLGDDVLVQTIQLQPGRYDTDPDALIALRKAGVSDRVIAAMQAHAAGLVVRPAPGADNGAAAGPLEPGALAAGVDEIGVYYKLPQQRERQGQWLPLKDERVVFKSGGEVKSLLTHGVVGKDMNGHLDGTKSPLVLATGAQILIYAPNGTDAGEYQFIRFREHSDNREFRVLTGGVFHSESGSERDEIEFHPHKIAPQMYTFTVPVDIEKGEYGVLPPGSSNVRGIAGTGKIFTFSIRE